MSGYTYILFNRKNGTLYIGVTSNLVKRIYEHKNKLADGFTKKYGVDKLGYYEIFDNIEDAILRDKENSFVLNSFLLTSIYYFLSCNTCFLFDYLFIMKSK